MNWLYAIGGLSALIIGLLRFAAWQVSREMKRGESIDYSKDVRNL